MTRIEHQKDLLQKILDTAWQILAQAIIAEVDPEDSEYLVPAEEIEHLRALLENYDDNGFILDELTAKEPPCPSKP